MEQLTGVDGGMGMSMSIPAALDMRQRLDGSIPQGGFGFPVANTTMASALPAGMPPSRGAGALPDLAFPSG